MGQGQLPDSGKRVGFGERGAVREADDAKPAMEGISPYAMERLGHHLRRGGVKYGNFRNWEAGMHFSRMFGAILRHTFAYMRRDDSEDHLAAILWNAMCLIHFEETGQSVEWDDRPEWPRPSPPPAPTPEAPELSPEQLDALGLKPRRAYGAGGAGDDA